MSDYASFITVPFWENEFPELAAWFRENEWAEIRGDKNTVAFAGILRDLSENGLVDQFMGIALKAHGFMKPGHDIEMSLLGTGERPLHTSARKARASLDEYVRRMEPHRLKMTGGHETATGEIPSTPDMEAFFNETR